MNNILIVEDEWVQAEYIAEVILKINEDFNIYRSVSVEKALKIAEDNLIEVFLIDVELIDGSGLEFAKKLRNMDKYQFTPIIFITGFIRGEMKAFKEIHCYDYIIKPFDNKELEKAIRPILVNYLKRNEEDETLTLEFKYVKSNIKLQDILYIESKLRKINIITKYETIEYKQMSIKNFKKILNSNFIQVHQSIVINKKYIRKIDLNENVVYLENIDNIIPIGRSYKRIVGDLI